MITFVLNATGVKYTLLGRKSHDQIRKKPIFLKAKEEYSDVCSMLVLSDFVPLALLFK